MPHHVSALDIVKINKQPMPLDKAILWGERHGNKNIVLQVMCKSQVDRKVEG